MPLINIGEKQPATLCYFASQPKAICVTILEHSNGDLELVVEIMGNIQPDMSLKGSKYDALFVQEIFAEFSAKVHKIMADLIE